MLTSLDLLLWLAYGVPGHMMGQRSATTPVAMCFRPKIGPFELDGDVYCGKANRVVRIRLFECSLAPILYSHMLRLMACQAT